MHIHLLHVHRCKPAPTSSNLYIDAPVRAPPGWTTAARTAPSSSSPPPMTGASPPPPSLPPPSAQAPQGMRACALAARAHSSAPRGGRDRVRRRLSLRALCPPPALSRPSLPDPRPPPPRPPPPPAPRAPNPTRGAEGRRGQAAEAGRGGREWWVGVGVWVCG